MENNITLNREVVIETLKKVSTLREATVMIYGIFEKKFEKRIRDFLVLNDIDWKQYCSKPNEKHYYCKYCGKEILGKERTRKQFCDHSCAAKYTNNGKTKSIETRLKISNSISETYWKTHNKEKTEKQTKREKFIKECRENFNEDKIYYCINCGKEIKNPSISKKNLYCCKKCQKEYEYKTYIEKWKNGENDGLAGEYGTSKHIKKYLFEKYDNKCQLCGWGEKNVYTGNIPLQIHHIDGDCTNNKEENLQLLCPNCHSLTDNYGSRNKNCTKGRTDYYSSKKRKKSE